VRARARLEVARRGDRDVLVDVRSDPPMSIRSTPGRILVVGSAAAPVGGDELELDVVVGPGATAEVGTAAATMVWPGPAGECSVQTTRIRVGAAGSLVWHPEPVVSVAGSRHRSVLQVDLAADARVDVLEEISLGRTGESSGRLDLEVRIGRCGQVVVHHVERLGPDVAGWGSAVHMGPARHVLSGVVVGEPAGPPATLVRDPMGGGVAAAWMPMASDVATVLVVAPDRPAAHAALRELRTAAV